MPISVTHWLWEEAFDKYGFNDGDDPIATSTVGQELTKHGYDVEYETFGMHNTVIVSILSPDGTELIDKWVESHLDDPREYLPKEVVKLLDNAFPARDSVSLEINGFTVVAYATEDSVVIDAYTDTNESPVASTSPENKDRRTFPFFELKGSSQKNDTSLPSTDT